MELLLATRVCSPKEPAPQRDSAPGIDSAADSSPAPDPDSAAPACEGLQVPEEYGDLAQAVAASSDSDTICVAPGSYSTPLDLSQRELRFVAWGGAEQTTLDLSDLEGPWLTMVGGEVQLQGFAFAGLDVQAPGEEHTVGWFADVQHGRLVLDGVVFRDNRWTLTRSEALTGGGLRVVGTQLSLRDVRVERNTWTLPEDVTWPADIDGGWLYAAGGSQVEFQGLEASDNALVTEGENYGSKINGLLVHTLESSLRMEQVSLIDSELDLRFYGSARINGALLFAESSVVQIEGLSVRGLQGSLHGDGYLHGAMALWDSNSVLRDVVLEEVTLRVDKGTCHGALYQAYGSVVARELQAYGNRCAAEQGHAYGAAVSMRDGDFDLVGGDVRANVCAGGSYSNGGALALSPKGREVRLAQVVLAGNRAGEAEQGYATGGGLDLEAMGSSTATLQNLTFFGNATQGHYPTGAGIALLVAEGAVVDLRNLSATGNACAETGCGGLDLEVQGSPPTTEAYNNLEHTDLEPHETDLALDPGFVDISSSEARDWDLQLAEGSALIDAGDPEVLDADGSRSDIWAYGGPPGG